MFSPECVDDGTIALGALPCDAYHHYYHYRAAAQFLWLAQTLRKLGREEEASAAQKKAVFQDHSIREDTRPEDYDKHPASETEFLQSVGKETGIVLQDAECFRQGKEFFAEGNYEKALAEFAEATRLCQIAHDAYHQTASDAHVKRGKEFLAAGQRELAINEFNKALDLHRGNAEAGRMKASA